MDKKFVKGQEVWLELTGNLAKNLSGDNQVISGEVLSVGTKYVHVQPNGGYGRPTKFDIKSLHEIGDWTGNYSLYLSKQDILDKRESRKLNHRLFDKFSRSHGNNFNLSLDQLRRIVAILDEDKGIDHE